MSLRHFSAQPHTTLEAFKLFDYGLTEVNDDWQEFGFVARKWQALGLRKVVDDAGSMPDRSTFVATPAKLSNRLRHAPIQLAYEGEPTDTTVHLSAKAMAPYVQDGETTPDELQDLLDRNSSANRLIGVAVEIVRQERAKSLGKKAWWHKLDDTAIYTGNPFERNPTEQFVIGRDQTGPVTVYNFGEVFTHRHLIDITKAVDLIGRLTNGHSRELVPNIVTHEEFKPRYFTRSKLYTEPAGHAWQEQPFVEINRASFEGHEGSACQSWLEQVVSHELHHQIDASVNPSNPNFERFFKYVDDDQDGLVDRTVPLEIYPEPLSEDMRRASRPARDYGYTNAKEDFSVTAERAPFAGPIDPIRLHAYKTIVGEFIAQQEGLDDPRRVEIGMHRRFGETVIQIEQRTGNDMTLPDLPHVDDPIRLKVDMASPSLFERIKHVIDNVAY